MDRTAELTDADQALLALLRRVAAAGYQFAAPAPSSHRRVLLRRRRQPVRGLEDVFGWNRPFSRTDVEPEILELMEAGGILKRRGDRLQSGLRIASLGAQLFWHSGYPPSAKDTVFLGPDSYRFAAFIRAELPALPAGAALVDIGAGAGVGGLYAQRLQPHVDLTLTDINPLALRLAGINAAFTGQTPALVEGDGLPEGGIYDVALANPPYIGGSGVKTYSAGGGTLGAGLSLAWAKAAIARLAPGGRMLLYTGAAMTGGRDGLKAALVALCESAGCRLSYRELDPDVFPATLLRPSYWRVERIAAVGAVIFKPR